MEIHKKTYEKISNELLEIQNLLEFLNFELKEQEIQENLYRVDKEMRFNDKIQTSKDLADNLKKRANILTELSLFDVEKTNIKEDINELNLQYQEIIKLTDKFKGMEGFSEDIGLRGQTEVKILEFKRKLLFKNQELQRLTEELEGLKFLKNEIEAKIEGIEIDIITIEKKQEKMKENSKLEEETNDYDKEKDGYEEKDDYEENSMEIKAKTRSLSEKRRILEKNFEILFTETKKKHEEILNNRKEFLDLLKDCQEKENLKRFFEKSQAEVLKELSPLLDNLKESFKELEEISLCFI